MIIFSATLLAAVSCATSMYSHHCWPLICL